MDNSTVLNIEIEKFDFINFLNEIRENLSEVMDTSFIPMYMRQSSSDKNIYVDVFDEKFECLSTESILEDIKNNDRILYTSFVLDKAICEEEGFICGDGTKLDEANYGDFRQDDSGFIIETKEKMIKIRKATYGYINPVQEVAKIVDDAGEFEEIIKDFIKRYIKE